MPGEKGADGRTSYLHIKYSDDGVTFTANNGETPGAYIGTYVDFVQEDSMNFEDYTWNKVKGVKVFTVTPYTPYDIGDIWIKPDGSTMVCINKRQTGAFTASDWRDVSENKFDAPGYVLSTPEGIKVFDASDNLRVLMGSWLKESARKYGIKIIDGEIYSSSFSTRNPGETKAYAEINTEGDIRIYDPFGQLGMLIFGGWGQGTIEWYLDGIKYATANIAAGSYKDLWIRTRRSDSGIRLATYNGQYIEIGSGGGSNIEVKAGTSGTVYVDSTMVVDDFYATGTKDAVQETENYGYRSLTARESPEAKYVDEGKACLVNGECRIELDPIFLECIEPNTSETPWLFHLTPLAPLNLYVAEIGETYFVVKDVNNALEGEFCWAVSGTRKGYAGRRFIEHKLEDIKPKQPGGLPAGSEEVGR